MATKEELQKRIEAKLNAMPPEQRARVEAYYKDPERRKVFAAENKARVKLFPLKNLIPNIAQERALECYRHPNVDAEYEYPIYNICTGGNGVGKTVELVITLAGCSQGVEFLNQNYFDHEFFKKMEARRKTKPLLVWLICKKDDMTLTGSVYNHIKDWIPSAKFGGKVDGKYYTEIEIPPTKPGYHKTVVSIKTFNMELVSFSGSNIDLILGNEPLKDKDKFDECVGRIRNDGYMAWFLTPLDGTPYLHKVAKNARAISKGMVCHTKGNIWENCRDRPGTNGVLSETAILAQIEIWKQTPLTLDARVKGEFTDLSGAIFPIFRPNVHVIKKEHIPNFLSKNDYIVQSVDHHPSKPAVGVWMKLDALCNWHVVAEYPTDPWDEIKVSEKSIQHFGFDFKIIEAGKLNRFSYMKDLAPVQERFGDPNAFACKQKYGTVIKTLRDQYKDDCGLWYDLNVDNSIELRHDQISKLLYFDVKNEISASNTPKLFIYEGCFNVINALQYYVFGDNGKPEEDWKDWIDCIGYIVTSISRYKTPKDKLCDSKKEYEAIFGGRGVALNDYSDGYFPEKASAPDGYGAYSTYGLDV